MTSTAHVYQGLEQSESAAVMPDGLGLHWWQLVQVRERHVETVAASRARAAAHEQMASQSAAHLQSVAGRF